MQYVTDTHAFLWYLLDSRKLSPRAREVFEAVDRGDARLIVSVIVLLECIDILDKKKVAGRFDEIISKIAQASNFVISELDLGLVLEVNTTKGLRDLHDRVLVATAKRFDAPLVSKDRIIKEYYPRVMW